MSNALKTKLLQMSADELYAALYTCPLTKVMNRRAFEDSGVDSPFVGIVDVDSLKWVNDNHPQHHRAGDRLLCDMAARLAEEFGAENVYRLGGDEFAVVHVGELDIAARLASVARTFNRFSYGVGADLIEADTALGIDKLRRVAEGTRAARGEQPAWGHIV